MDVLDSPIEALAFDYVSFGILAVVNNLWTWLAVVTAAVSFWRIRAGGGAVVSCNQLKSGSCNGDGQIGSTSSPTTAEPERACSPAPAKGTAFIAQAVSEDRVTKGKFTVHFESDDGYLTAFEERGQGDGELTAYEEISCQWDDGEWWESWERLLRLRDGDGEGGWYRHQDLTVINGNVVRLWDGYSMRSW